MENTMKIHVIVVAILLSGVVCKSIEESQTDVTFREGLLQALQKYAKYTTETDDVTKYAKASLQDLLKLRVELQAEKTKKQRSHIEHQVVKDFDFEDFDFEDIMSEILGLLGVGGETNEDETSNDDNNGNDNDNGGESSSDSEGDIAGNGKWVNMEECGKRQSSPNRSLLGQLKSILAEMKSSSVGAKVVNGVVVDVAQYPWVVYMEVPEKENTASRCGGSLIASQWILTAAHCIHGKPRVPEMFVRVGEHDLKTDTEKTEDIAVEKPIIHPGYSPTDFFVNDIALLKLAHAPNVAQKNINTMCLTDHEFGIGTDCIVAGWGLKHGTDTSKLSTKLRRAEMQIQPNNKCPYFELADTQMCVGGTGGTGDELFQNSCQGDSGGPLFCRQNGGPYYQAGLVSLGNRDNCADPRLMSIYTRVSTYIDWIAETIANN